MESGLRASMDGDLSSINARLSAQHHLIQALSITQGEHTGEFGKLNTKLDHIVALLERLIADEGTAEPQHWPRPLGTMRAEKMWAKSLGLTSAQCRIRARESRGSSPRKSAVGHRGRGFGGEQRASVRLVMGWCDMASGGKGVVRSPDESVHDVCRDTERHGK